MPATSSRPPPAPGSDSSACRLFRTFCLKAVTRDTLLSLSVTYSRSHLPFVKTFRTSPILQMRNWKIRGREGLAQGHDGGQGQSQIPARPV